MAKVSNFKESGKSVIRIEKKSRGTLFVDFLIFSIIIFGIKNITNFATADRTAEARSRATRVGLAIIAERLLCKDILKSVYPTLFLDYPFSGRMILSP
ncbi:MAG: hypothetical protein HDS01_08505 [Bacteroides sp.]|nr:hypothetical protein [Bacteroides sp.]